MAKNLQLFSPYLFPDTKSRVKKILDTSWIGQGPVVDEFEQALQTKFNFPNITAVSTNSAAIRMALQLIGVGPGDEVITTPMACTATNLPILEQFARPIFADILYENGNLDPNSIEKLITPKTKAILCYHWGGNLCDLYKINKIAQKHRLKVIEDASDALGAKYQNKEIGNISDFTVLSFQATQKLTAIEGGALICKLKTHYQKAKLMRWYGIDRQNRTPNISGYYDFDINQVGYGYHLTNVNAATGLGQLEHFDSMLERVNTIAAYYRRVLAGQPGLTLFAEHPDNQSSHHLFMLHVEKRPDFIKTLKNQGISTSIVHERNDNYSVFGPVRHDLAGLNRFAKSYVAIPIHSRMTLADAKYIVEVIKKGW